MQISERSTGLSMASFALPFIAGQFVHVSSCVFHSVYTDDA